MNVLKINDDGRDDDDDGDSQTRDEQIAILMMRKINVYQLL